MLWDADRVRDNIRDFVVEHLGNRDSVLAVEEPGDLKKGTASVGLQRRYTGTAGRIENFQVAVHLVYSTPVGHAAIDRPLYIPRSWTQDPDRRRAASIPDNTGFATKPALATEMIAPALDPGVTAAWVTGAEVYGGDPPPECRARVPSDRLCAGRLAQAADPYPCGVFTAGEGLAAALGRRRR